MGKFATRAASRLLDRLQVDYKRADSMYDVLQHVRCAIVLNWNISIAKQSTDARKRAMSAYMVMISGNLIRARQSFLKALEREPGNPTILNNLKLLDESQRFLARSPDAP